jgi:hypothetical protein
VTAQPEGGAPVRLWVAAGEVVLPAATTRVTFGLAYAHEVEPPALVVPTGPGISLDRPYRPVRVVFRVLGTPALRADTGAGLCALDLGPPSPSLARDVAVRALGWRRGIRQPPWRVSQDDPTPCTILSITTEIKGDA